MKGRRVRIGFGLLAVLAVVSSAVLSSCGGGDGSSEGSAGTTTTTAARNSRLIVALPRASDVGSGYRVEKSSRTHRPEPFDPATTTTTTATRFNRLDASCPGARWPRLGARPDVAGVEYVQFQREDDREISVGLTPVPAALDRAGMDRLLDAINACGTFTNERGGVVSTSTVRAERIEGVGDYGIDIHSSNDMGVEGQDLPMDLSTSSRTYLLVVDDILVAVEADGGFDPDELATVSGDDDLVPAVAQTTVERLRD